MSIKTIPFAITIFLIVSVNQCSKPFIGEGLVILSNDDVKVDSRPAKVSDKILSGQKLVTGPESMAHVQFTHEAENSVALNIINEKSQFSFTETTPKKNKNLTFRLGSGSGSFRYSQITEKVMYTLETPTVAVVAGKGDFQVKVEDNGDTTINVLTGLLKGYRLLPAEYYEKIPPRTFSEVKDFKDTIALWKTEAVNMESGKIYFIGIEENRYRARKAGLEKILLEAMSNSDLQATEPEKKAEAEKQFTKNVEKNLASDSSAKKYIETSMKEDMPFKVEKLSTPELAKRLKEIEGLTYIDPQKITESKNLIQLIKDRNEAIKPALMNTVAVNKSGNVGKITTNDGRNIDCVIYTDEQAPDYYFCDPVIGKEVEKFPRKEVKVRFTEQ